MNSAERSLLIKQETRRLGFDLCGISKAEFLEEEAPRLEQWLKAGRQGSMHYMENYFEKRLDPRKLVPGARSVISVLLNYFPSQKQNEAAPKISKYAYGEDYHTVIKDKLQQLIGFIEEKFGTANSRCFVDSAPVMDKAWARRSGLGWIGKNANLINKDSGSFFFIGEVITDLELAHDGAMADYCGTCTRCLDACPTQAITEPYVVDGSKCISYFTIELKDQIPATEKGKFQDWMFGCDICQDVCPWNSFAHPTTEKRFQPIPQILGFSKADWMELKKDAFKKIFRHSPLSRPKYEGIRRNLEFLD